MIKLKKLLTEGYSREYLEKIVNNIKNNININEYLFDMDLPSGIYRRVLQKCQNVNIYNFAGYTPLHDACWKGNIQIVKLLSQHPKINVNIQNRWGDTPLHSAYLRDNVQIVKLLLNHPKINANIKNKDGKTPIELTNNEQIKELFKK